MVIEGDALPRPPGGDPFSIDAAAVVSSHFGEAMSFFAGTPPLNALVIPNGTNGRFCESCHNNERGWILGPSDAQSRFRTGAGSVSLGPRSASNESAAENDDMDPIFRRVDGTVSPLADVSTPSARERAYALLLSKALFRVGLPMPGDAEFSLAEVDDPYGYASARGEALFNERSFAIAGVRGLNDELGRHVIEGTCTSCHNAPNVGSNSEGWLMDIGASDASRRTPDLPLYTFVHRTSKETIRTTDPGRALVTGRWRDMNRFKVPALRGLAVRAPYLHDGSAPTLAAVVDFHDARFQIGLTPDEKQDLIAFLASL